MVNSLMLVACLAICDVKVASDSVDDCVDVIELHHGYDFRGHLAFRQLIFYRWSSYHRRFQVVDTVVVTHNDMLPQPTRSGYYRSRWVTDGETRIVTGLTFRRSDSKVDPEVAERDFLPTHLRQGLKKVQPETKTPDPIRRTSAIPPRPQQLLKF